VLLPRETPHRKRPRRKLPLPKVWWKFRRNRNEVASHERPVVSPVGPFEARSRKEVTNHDDRIIGPSETIVVVNELIGPIFPWSRDRFHVSKRPLDSFTVRIVRTNSFFIIPN
jgi:hypothetical protein